MRVIPGRLSRIVRRFCGRRLHRRRHPDACASASAPTRRSSASSTACSSSRCRSTSRTGSSASGTRRPGSTSRGSTVGRRPTSSIAKRAACSRTSASGTRAAVSVTGTGEPERVQAIDRHRWHAARAAGRSRPRPLLHPEDDSPRTPERVMLDHAYWQRKFGARPGAIGRQSSVDGRRTRSSACCRRPSASSTSSRRSSCRSASIAPKVHVAGFNYQGVARLKPGVTIEQANADIARHDSAARRALSDAAGLHATDVRDVKMGPNVRPLADDVIGDVGQVLWILLGTVGLVLLIACANVANLFLVRAEGRQQELAIHAALGASRRRIACELLAESMTLGARSAAPSAWRSPYAGVRAAGRHRARRPAARRTRSASIRWSCSSRSRSRSSPACSSA